MASVRATQILSEVIDGVADGVGLPQRMVVACAVGLPVTGAGLALVTEHGPGGMLAATDGPAAVLEDLQFSLGEGPCVDSSATGRPVLHPDLALSGPARWPGFAAGALQAGVRAVFAFPLGIGGIQLGTLDLYRDAVGGLLEDALGEALFHADAATMLLLHLHSEHPVDALGSGWLSEGANRSEVHQATGMISVQAGVGLREALLLLRARAFAAERPLGAVARDVVDRAVRFDSELGYGKNGHEGGAR
jgi:hypothetical protein